MRYSLKQKIGVLILDLLKFELCLNQFIKNNKKRSRWIEICNRNERLDMASQNQGVRCLWKWTSELHAAKVFPSLGSRLMQRALDDWPIQFKNTPPQKFDNVLVSFIIGHKGPSRLPHLLTVLKTIAAQNEIAFECIVVEQSEQPEIKRHIPRWVRYHHAPPNYNSKSYSRAYAFNVGARLAKGKLLILHDNDMLIPQDYAFQLVGKHRQGYDVINLKRYIFYMNKDISNKIISLLEIDSKEAPERIVQNLEAGGGLAVSKEAFFNIGGFDEAFMGWGGEDNEFWDRAQTCSVWPFTYLPLIHLWHPPQVEKTKESPPNIDLYKQLSAIPIQKRIDNLRIKNMTESDTDKN